MRAFFIATSVAIALFGVFWYTFGGPDFFGKKGAGSNIVASIWNAGGTGKRSPEAAPSAPTATTALRKYAALTSDHSPPTPTVFPMIPKAPVKPQIFPKLAGDHSPPSSSLFPTTPSLLSDGSADLTTPLGTVFPVKFSTLPDAAPIKFAALSGDHSPPAATVSPAVPSAPPATKPPAPTTFPALSADHSPPAPTVFPVVPKTFAKLEGDHSPPKPTVFPVVPVAVAKSPPQTTIARIGSPSGRYVVAKTTPPVSKPAEPAPKPEAKAEAIVFPIRFNFAKNTFTTKGRLAANDLLAYVTSRKLSSITLSGHTDERGSEQNNQKLSKRRLEGVAKHLRAGGYVGAIILQPRGESEPFTKVNRNDYSLEQLYDLDRRVELRAAK